MSAARSSKPDSRHSASHPCPVCKGHDGEQRGQGERCHGFLSGDYVHCSREEHAGQASYHPGSLTYAHKAAGACPCGHEHRPATPKPGAKARSEIVATYDYRDPAGAMLFQVVKLKPKSFRQRRPDPAAKGGWAWNLQGVQPVPYRLPELLAADLSSLVFLVEGEKDADRLAKFEAIASTSPMGAGKWRDTYSPHFKGRDVAILPDNDQVGRDHAQAVARSLAPVARSVKVLELPDLAEHGDVSDWLDRGHSIADLKNLAAAAEAWSPPIVADEVPPTIPIRPEARTNPRPDLPSVICGSDDPAEGLKLWTPQALAHLAASNRAEPTLFQRGGLLCRMKRTNEGGPPAVEPICRDGLRGMMDRSASYAWEVTTKKGSQLVYGPPRMEIVRDILALGSLDPEQFPVLEGISESPQFSSYGELILARGYHAPSKTFYAPPPELDGISIPDRPSLAEVDDAKWLILDNLLVDISFANEASRSNAVALMLLPFVRQMISGPTPNHHITASTEGTGKGLLAAACAYPFLGREISTNAQKESEAEWRKALTSFFLSGESHYFIDNMFNPRGWDDVPQTLDSGTLANAWTTPQWKDRLLGGNREINIKVRSIFLSSANNLEWSRELRRRLTLIELMALEEIPSLRTGFKHDPLMDWAKANRVALTRACLVLCRHWIAEGRKLGEYVMGSYEAYARTMGGILDACGIQGFLGNRPKAVKRDPEANRWGALVYSWQRQYPTKPVMTAELWEIINQSSELGEMFGELLGDGSAMSQKARLGKALDRQEGRVWGEVRIVRSAIKAATKVALWKLSPKSDPLIEDDAVEDGDSEDWTKNQ